MAKNYSYKVDLDIGQSAQSKVELKEFNNRIKEADHSLKDIRKSYFEAAKASSDLKSLQTEYNKILDNELKLVDKKQNALLKMLDTESQAHRQRYQELQLQRESVDLTEEQKAAIDSEIKALERKYKNNKDLLKLTDSQLKTKLFELDADKKRIKLMQFEAKQAGSMEKADKRSLKSLKERIKEQVKLTKEIIKSSKAFKTFTSVAGGVAKGGAAVVGGGLAAGAAIMAGASNAANKQVEKEKALRSLKNGISPELVDSVYLKTRADWGSIVGALNSMSDITSDNNKLLIGALAELEMPGFGSTLLSQENMTDANIESLYSQLRQIKASTGATDIGKALEFISKQRVVSNQKVSQVDAVNAYATLSAKGVDDETISRILRDVANKKGDFVDNWNSLDLSKYIRGDSQLAQRLANSDLKLTETDQNRGYEQTDSERLIEQQTELELMLDKAMMELVPIALEVFKVLDPKLLKDVFSMLGDALRTVVPYIVPLLDTVVDCLTMLPWVKDPRAQQIKADVDKDVEALYERAKDLDFENQKIIYGQIADMLTSLAEAQREGDVTSMRVIRKQTENIDRLIKNAEERQFDFSDYSLPEKALGGLVNSRSIVGEAGPELVIPVGNGKAGRVGNIVNNYFNTSQSFNIPNSNPTVSNMVSTVKRNKFIRGVL